MEEKKKKNWFKRHPILTVIGAIILIFVIIGAVSGGDNSPTSNTNEADSGEEQTAAPMEVVTTDFIAEFDANQLAAEEKYVGKPVQFTAKINNISEDIMGSPFLSLVPENADEYYLGTTIQCVFEEASQLTSLTNGQTVTVKGTAAEQTVGIISVKDCEVVN